MAYLRSRGEHGATRQEAEAALGIDQNSLRPRWWELEKAGMIQDSGAKRRNRNGNNTEIYIATGD